MTKDEALKLALEAIEELRYSSSTFKSDKLSAEAIAAIKEALAEPEHGSLAYAGVRVWMGNQNIVHGLHKQNLTIQLTLGC